MNKKGQMIFFGIMISVMVWIAFSQMIGPVKDATRDARAADQLDCGNSSISVGTKATCVITDWTLFGWASAIIAVIIGAAGGNFADRLLGKKQ